MLPLSRSEKFLWDFVEVLSEGGAPPDPGPEVDWDGLFSMADKQKLLPLFSKAYADAAPAHIQEKHAPRLSRLLNASAVQRSAVQRLSVDFTKAGIEFLILKGVCYQELLYDGLSIRPCFDMDFLVRDEKNAEKAHGILVGQGFQPGQNWNPSTRQFEKLDGFHLKYNEGHEYLEYYRKVGDFVEIAEIGIKVHTLSPVFTLHALGRKRALLVGETPVPTCSVEDIFICMVENFFSDNGTPYAMLFGSGRLRDYMDLRLFLRKYGQTLDWPYVLERLIEERSAHKVYFVAKRLKARFGSGLPAEIDSVCEALFRLSQMRAYQLSFWAQVGAEGPLGSYEALLSTIGQEYTLIANGLKKYSPVRNRIEASVIVDGNRYNLSFERINGRLYFAIMAETGIPEELVFSVERIVPGDFVAFESFSARLGGQGAKFHGSKGNSFHSMGRLAKADGEEWETEPIASQVTIRVDATAHFSGGFGAAEGLVFLYSFSIHKKVVGNVYHHLFGDDLDALFLSKFALLSA